MVCTGARALEPSGGGALGRPAVCGATAASVSGTARARGDRMSTPIDLKERVETRRKELIKQLGELKNSAMADAETTRDAIRKRLSEIGHIVKEGVVDGWDSVNDAAKTRINSWLET
jgi:ACT domain-containing protein